MSPRTLPAKTEGRDRPKTIIAPSILSSDFAELSQECNRMIDLGADWLHVDVMDGHFVPNLTLGPPILKSLRKHTDAFLDCHLMVTHPEKWIDAFAQAGADMFTFHLEAVADPGTMGDKDVHVMEVIQKVRDRGMHVGIAIKPGTPAEHVLPYVSDLDLVLVLTVEPGFGGQSFMEDKVPQVNQKARDGVFHQVKKCKMIRDAFPTVQIEVDGGLAPDTIDRAAVEGANVIVAGSAIFNSTDPQSVISILRQSVDKAAVSQ